MKKLQLFIGLVCLFVSYETIAQTHYVSVQNPLPVATISSFTNPTSCALSDGIITATGAGASGTYSWNTTPPQLTAVATGLGAGTYTCTVTTAALCSDIVSQILVAPLAPTGTIASSDGDDIFCAGTSIDFTVTTTVSESRFLVNGTEVRGWLSGVGSNIYTTTALVTGDIVSAEVRDPLTPTCVGPIAGITNTVNALPALQTVTVSTVNYCVGAAVPNLHLNSSELNFTYQLQNWGTVVNVGAAVVGTGVAIDIPWPAGDYHLLITNPTTSCSIKN